MEEHAESKQKIEIDIVLVCNPSSFVYMFLQVVSATDPSISLESLATCMLCRTVCKNFVLSTVFRVCVNTC